MKRWLLLLLFFPLSYSIATAQNIKVWIDEPVIRCAMGSLEETVVSFQNVSDQEITILVKRIDAKMGKGQEAFFRFGGKTTASRIDESQNTLTLSPGEVSTEFIACFSTGFKKGQSKVEYRFQNVDNKKDYADLEMLYDVSSEIPADRLYVNEQISVSFMYPNPAVHYGEFEYKMSKSSSKYKARITVHNVLGKQLGAYDLPTNEQSIRIAFRDFKPGVYFYTLVLDDETVATKKFIIKR